MKLDFERRVIELTTEKDNELNRLRKELAVTQTVMPKYSATNSSSSMEDRVRALLVDLES